MYELKPNQSAEDIITALTTGKTDDIAITIPEDRTVADIDDLLAEKGTGEPGILSRVRSIAIFRHLHLYRRKIAGLGKTESARK